MKELLTSGAVGSIELDAQRKINEAITKRWTDMGMLEGLQGNLKNTIATLYESQARHLIKEATTADSSGSFETVVFPLIRRVFSKLLAQDIVSVQSISLPVGKVFFLLPKTSERSWSIANPEDKYKEGITGSHSGLMGYQRVNRFYEEGKDGNIGKETINKYALPREAVVFGDDGQELGADVQPGITKYMEKSLYDLFYNDFLFDNSKGRITIRHAKAELVAFNENGELTKLDDTSKIILSQEDGSIRSVLLKVSGFSSFNVGKLTGPDGNEMDTEAFLSTLKVISKAKIPSTEKDGIKFTEIAENESLIFRVVTQKYGKGIVDRKNNGYNRNFCDVNGDLYIEVDLTKPTMKQQATFDGFIGISPESHANLNPDDAFLVVWGQYDSLEYETEIGEVSFEISDITIAVEERKLRATWSPELAQDVNAFHNIDAEAELTALLAEQISAEIDREILRDLRKSAAWTGRWDYLGWRRTTPQVTLYTQKDWNQTLITKINQLSAQIHKSTLRGGANFMVVSSEVSAVLNDLEYFHVTDASAEANQYNMGIEKIGSINGRYQVVVDPYAPHYSVIIGHKGTSLLDTGYIYAPYIPLALTPAIYNPHTLTPVKGISTRYAKKVVNNRLYATLVVDSLPHFNLQELR